MSREMYDIAIPSTMMALVFLGLLYSLFHMGLRENLSASVKRRVPKSIECSIDGRVAMMVFAWNDTVQSPQKNDMDSNVYYQIWYSNVLRRGLNVVYTCPLLFAKIAQHSKEGTLDAMVLRHLMIPYYEREVVPPAAEMMPLAPVCHNP